MPTVDQKAGSCYVWVITTFLFICIASGGVLLGIYMSQPDASSWYPIAGISLICLPWLFWFLTFFYRVLSRRLGFRMVCWGAYVDSPPRTFPANGSMAESTANANGGETKSATGLESGTAASPTTTDGGRRVHFGGAVVLGDENGGSGHDCDGSLSSQDSEAPLRYSMAA